MGCGSSRNSKNVFDSSHILPIQTKSSKEEPALDKFHEIDSGLTCIDNNSSNSTEDSSITIIHFNDVYNIEPRDQEPVGGASRFVTKVNEFSVENPLILFSGDCLNPSLRKCTFYSGWPSINI